MELAFAAYLPVPHASQLPLPCWLWERPVSQSLHDAAAFPPHFPAPQTLPCSDDFELCEPALQAMHDEAPLAPPV